MKNTTSIKDNDLYRKIMDNGSWYGGDFLCAYILQNNLDSNMIGLAIGKKVGKAYKRNKVKRWIKESYKKLESSLKLGYYIIFVWKSKAEYDNVDYNGIDKDINKILSKAGLL